MQQIILFTTPANPSAQLTEPSVIDFNESILISATASMHGRDLSNSQLWNSHSTSCSLSILNVVLQRHCVGHGLPAFNRLNTSADGHSGRSGYERLSVALLRQFWRLRCFFHVGFVLDNRWEAIHVPPDFIPQIDLF